VLRLIVVSLPPGKTPFAVQLNNKNNKKNPELYPKFVQDLNEEFLDSLHNYQLPKNVCLMQLLKIRKPAKPQKRKLYRFAVCRCRIPHVQGMVKWKLRLPHAAVTDNRGGRKTAHGTASRMASHDVRNYSHMPGPQYATH
jgi:hypothetical protein